MLTGSVEMFAVVVGHREKSRGEPFWSPALPLSVQEYLVRNVHYDLRCAFGVFSLWISSEWRRISSWMRTMKQMS